MRASKRFLAARIELDRQRLRALAPDVDVELVERHLQTLLAISEGSSAGGPVAALPAPERFHWLVAPRSTMIQTSAVHVGRSDDPRQALDELMRTLVQRAAPSRWPRSCGVSGMPAISQRVQWLISFALFAAIVVALVLGALVQQPLGGS